MKNIVIDTCVLIHIIRANTIGKKCLEVLEAFGTEVNIIVSVVTKAELESFSWQYGWEEKKIKKIIEILNEATIIDIQAGNQILVEAYSYVDGYSKSKIPNEAGDFLVGTARKMGKNDLWIAATAKALDAPLLTTDKDFEHLHANLLEVINVK